MAAKSTIDIVFGAVDNASGTFNKVGKGLGNLEADIGSITGPLANLTGDILKLDAALAAVALAITGYSIKISDDFDTAFGEISTLIGQPASSLRDFQAQILEYSESSSASLQEITQSTYGAISAGVEYKDSLKLISAAEKLAIAGKADLGSTTTALVSTLNAFGASADEAGDYADTFFKTVQLGQTTIPELSNTIGRLAPIAAAAGLTFDEMGAAIATITAETGTSTAEAITGIRAAVNAFLKPAGEATKLAESLGLEFNAAMLESEGFAGALEIVAKKTGGNTETMAKLFGSVEALAPMLALTGNASEKFASNLDAFGNKSGAANQAAKELESSLSLLSQTMTNNLNSALISVGSQMTDETRSIVQSLSESFKSLGDEIKLSDGAFQPILKLLDGLAGDIDTKLQAIAKNMPEALGSLDFTDLAASFTELTSEIGDAFKNVFGDLDLTTVEGLQAALQKIVDGFTALVNITDGIIEGMQPLFALIGEGIENFQDLDGETKNLVGNLLGVASALDKVLPALTLFGGALAAISTVQIGKAVASLAGFAKSGTVIAGTTAAVARLAASFTPLGLAVNVAAGAVAVATTDFDDLWYSIQKLIGIETELEKQHKKSIASIDKMGKSIAELRKQYEAGELSSVEYNKAVSEISGITRDWASNIASAVDGNEALEDAAKKTGKEISKQVDEIEKTSTATEVAAKSGESLAKSGKEIGTAFEEAAGKLGVARTEIEELAFNDRLRLIEVAFDIQSEQAKQKLDLLKTELGSIGDFFDSTGNTIVDMFEQLGQRDGYDRQRLGFIEDERYMRGKLFEQQRDSLKLAQEELKNQGQMNGGVQNLASLLDLAAQKYANSIGGSIDQSRVSTKNLLTETGKLVSKTEEASGSADQFKLKMEEISAGVYKTAVDLDISRAENALKSLQGAGETTMSAIGSTGGLISQLVDKVGDRSTSWRARGQFEDLLEQEVRMRQDALETAKSVAEAQVEQAESLTRLNNARAEAFSDGRAQIEIKADSLAPELSLVLEKIIEMSHVEALAGGREYLLGDI